MAVGLLALSYLAAFVHFHPLLIVPFSITPHTTVGTRANHHTPDIRVHNCTSPLHQARVMSQQQSSDRPVDDHARRFVSSKKVHRLVQMVNDAPLSRSTRNASR